MESIEFLEKPSEVRRRLSQNLKEGNFDSRALQADGGATVAALQRFAAEHQEGSAPPSPSPKTQGTIKKPENRRISVVTTDQTDGTGFNKRMSAFSRVFALSTVSELYNESNIRPTLVNAMIFFKDPKPDIDKLRKILGDRLLSIPRFRSVVKVAQGNNLKSLLYEPIPRADVDLEEHFRHVDGRGTFNFEQDINALVNDAFLDDWPSDRPLWRITLVSNLKDGRSLLFVVIDHAIGDGVGLLSVFWSLMDDFEATTTDKSRKSLQKMRKKPPTKLSWSHKAIAVMRGIYDGTINVLAPPIDTVSGVAIPKNLLNEPCPGKEVAMTRQFPLSDIAAMKNRLHGATVNDMILTIITMGLRKTLEECNDPTLAEFNQGKGLMRGDFPVNMREEKEKPTEKETKNNLGNSFCLASFPFPMNYTDPIDCAWRCKLKVDELKLSPAFWLRHKVGNLLFHAVPVEELAARTVEAMNQSTCMVSNVMGPTCGDDENPKITMAGYDIDDLNFTTAFVGGLYIGALSFRKSLRLSIILDKRVSRVSAKEITDNMEKAYDELHDTLLAGASDDDDALEMPIERMVPRSARMLEWLAYTAAIAVPVGLAVRFARNK